VQLTNINFGACAAAVSGCFPLVCRCLSCCHVRQLLNLHCRCVRLLAPGLLLLLLLDCCPVVAAA
jgi:hypothetical protein